MATWTTITADTPLNSAAILQEYIDALYERSRAAGTSFSPASFWPALKVQAGRTVSGTHGIAVAAEAIAAGLGVAWWYSLRLAFSPVKPETLTITAGEQVLEDDGDGVLCQGEEPRGLVDYSTGCLRFTFDDPVPEDEPVTADYTADRTRLTASESCFTALHAGKRITVTGVGTFRILAVNATNEIEVSGNAATGGATFSISAAGTALDAAFWAMLQNALLDLVPQFVDSYNHPDGFEGSSEAIPLFDLATWREAAGLTSGFPRCVPTLSPLDGVYDAETDTTAITFTGEGWFVAGHVGARINIHGVGMFAIASVEDGTHATVSGDATCEDRAFSVLPQDWTDQADPAFGYTVAASGDVLGPWLLADLQAGLKVLRWTTSSFYPEDPCFVGWTADSEESWLVATGYSPTSYAQAKLACETDWAAGSPQVREDPPKAESRTYWNGDAYAAYLERCGNYIAWSVLGAAEDLACDLDLYVSGAAPGMTWDDNGDWPEGYTPDTLHLWNTVKGLAEPTGLTDTIFGQRSPTKPNWPPSNPGNVGYVAGDYPAALCRWDIAGGFAYA
ncbi:MAG: hypothetical protein IMZ44_23680 [Planctomycetes bacterium]|nr:hypothetical protein [Planctomycetota bacterium]